MAHGDERAQRSYPVENTLTAALRNPSNRRSNLRSAIHNSRVTTLLDKKSRR